VLGIVYLAVLWMLGISELDREVMRSAFKRIRRKRSRASTPSS